MIIAALEPDGAFALCRALRKRDLPLEPLLLLVSGAKLGDLEPRDDLFDDFASTRSSLWRLEARLKHLFWRTGRSTTQWSIRPARPQPRDLPGGHRGSLPLDLTYMEYEAAQVPGLPPGPRAPAGRAVEFWGYEYYGGARTVDVHPPPAGQARRGARQPDPDGPLRRLPLRPVPLGV